MKTAKVVPLYKKNSKSEPENYRPVSILTVMSKILEKTVHKQLENYLKSEKLLYDYQSGFRNSYSIDSCVTHLTDQIRFDMDKGNYTGMVMIDLQKDFDTVHRDILLNKLKAIGLDDLSTYWFSSYLKNRFKKTEVDGIFSDPMVVPCRVPQGSILGPLLFLIYLILYADDSALLVSGTSVSVIEETLVHELTFLCEWLVDNKLSIHLLGKTESILLGLNEKIRKQSTMKIICGDNEVTAKDNVKYLGVSLDQSLEGKYIAESILKKGNSSLKFLWRQAKYLNRNSTKLFATSLILIMPAPHGLRVNLQKKTTNFAIQNYEICSRLPP